MKCVLRSPACCGPPTRAESSAAPVVGMLKCDMRRAALVPVSPGCSLDQGLFSPSCLSTAEQQRTPGQHSRWRGVVVCVEE